MKLNRANLHEYQKYGVDFIINNPISALMLECGLGKTITTLTAVSDLMYDYFEISKVLIIAPLRVGLSVWKQECDKWEQLKYLRCSIAIGSADERAGPHKVPLPRFSFCCCYLSFSSASPLSACSFSSSIKYMRAAKS